jgi:hypothetical protein
MEDRTEIGIGTRAFAGGLAFDNSRVTPVLAVGATHQVGPVLSVGQFTQITVQMTAIAATGAGGHFFIEESIDGVAFIQLGAASAVLAAPGSVLLRSSAFGRYVRVTLVDEGNAGDSVMAVVLVHMKGA